MLRGFIQAGCGLFSVILLTFQADRAAFLTVGNTTETFIFSLCVCVYQVSATDLCRTTQALFESPLLVPMLSAAMQKHFFPYVCEQQEYVQC